MRALGDERYAAGVSRRFQVTRRAIAKSSPTVYEEKEKQWIKKACPDMLPLPFGLTMGTFRSTTTMMEATVIAC